MSQPLILQVAIDTPLYRLFDYQPVAGTSSSDYSPGCRVRVPFGRTTTIGMVMAISQHSELPASKLKRVLEILDPEPLLPKNLLRLLNWAADYYQHPIGEVVAAAIPKLLREGKTLDLTGDSLWHITASGKQSETPNLLQRAPKQAALRDWLADHGPADIEALAGFSENWRTAMAGLIDKGLAEKHIQPCLETGSGERTTAATLNPEQHQAVSRVAAAWGQFQTFLLHGITGSGKTEVYLALTEAAIAQGMQVLILVPEISLTPQLTRRFRQRLTSPIAALHSGLNDRQRQCAWGMAASSQVQVVIGTRSALFTPMPNLGLIIIDEEHDASLKQQEGFRYHARDLALVRAKQAAIPVLLGSATPSLESLYNAERGQYQLLQLRQRAALAKPPKVQVLDVRRRPLQDGLSDMLLQHIRSHLNQQGQVLLFLNRRGYAPLLMCHACGWTTDCPRCDAHMTLHQHSRRLHCHHCGHETPAPVNCPQCGNGELYLPGAGTERIEQALANHFPDIRMVRIDRDTTRRKGSLDDKLEQARSGEAKILIGTQMLAKGHDFPDVSLVGILDADQGLFSTDFRGTEHLAQLIIQVAGRAGRAERPGEVFIQTHQPDHPLLATLLSQGYSGFALAALEERRASELPPFSHLAILRAEASKAELVSDFLRQAKAQLTAGKIEIFGPLSAPMARRAGRQRMQLVLQSSERRELHNQLHNWVRGLAQIKGASKVRWSLDVDPVDLY